MPIFRTSEENTLALYYSQFKTRIEILVENQDGESVHDKINTWLDNNTHEGDVIVYHIGGAEYGMWRIILLSKSEEANMLIKLMWGEGNMKDINE